mgnify:CR=1 FL=1
MKIDNEIGDLILKILGAILVFFSFKWLIKLFGGKNGLDVEEFKKLAALILFVWAFIYVLIKEANRPVGTDHLFSEMWVFFILSALLTVLHLDGVLDKMSTLLQLMVQLRSKRIENETQQSKEKSQEL